MPSFRRQFPSLATLLIAAVVAASSVAHGSEVAVDRWLAVGPVPDPLPAFHDDKPGGYDVEALLDAKRLPADAESPKEGRPTLWFSSDSAQVWRAVDAGSDGRVALEAGGGPAITWLVAYLETDRWQSFTLKVLGTQPRGAWLDGEELAKGGGSDDDVSGTLNLLPGKHTLLIGTVRDPSNGDGWEIGATLERAEDAPSGDIRIVLDPARNIDIIDILDAPQITSIAISPDGTLGAATFRRTVPGESKAETWIEWRRLRDRQLLGSLRGFEPSALAFVPNSRRISYLTTDSDDDGGSTGTLWVADVDSGTVKPLIERVENLGGYLWSPTGTSVVYSASVKPEPDKRGVKRVEGLWDRRAGYRSKSYLYHTTLPGGATRRLTSGEVSTAALDISRDGKRLLFSRAFDDAGERPFTRNEIWEMDLATLETRRLREARWFNDAVYSPDGKKILVLAGPSAFDGAGANIAGDATPNDYDGQLYIWDPASGVAEAIGRDFDPSVEEMVWSPHDGNIYLRANDRDFIYLFRYDVNKKTFEKLKARFEALRHIAIADTEPLALVTGTSPWITQGMALVQLKDDAAVVKWAAGDWYTDTIRGNTRSWSFESSGGDRIDGRIYLPPGFDESRTYPCIVYYYGGVSPTDRAFGGRYPKEYWASQGYVVYVLQPSGTVGYGQSFSARHVNDWGEIVADEIIEGVGKFIEAHTFVDPKRVGAIGASYGGFMTMTLVTKTDIFAAAVSHAGISSISSYWGEGYWGYQYSAVATANSYPWNRKDLYLDKSPLFEADKVTTPILLTHGMDDTNVPRGESEQFFTALKLVNAPVEYIQVEGQDHLILDRDKRLVWSRTIVAWFDRWLKDQPEWWEHLYPERE